VQGIVDRIPSKPYLTPTQKGVVDLVNNTVNLQDT
jgi:hypothetical protein